MYKKTKLNHVITILSIVLVILPIFMILSYNRKQVQISVDKNLREPNISGVYEDILIDDLLTTNTNNEGNWAWALSKDWCTGSGTSEEPYIIEYQTFIYNSGGGECLTISNSRKYFIIRHCTILNSQSSSAGLYLNNVSNGQIATNNIYNNGGGIVLEYSNETIISNNEIYNNGIMEGFNMQYCLFNTISGNTLYNNSGSGIWINKSNYNTLTGNIAYNNTLRGIHIENSNTNHLESNRAYENIYYGIELEQSDYNNLSGNIVNNNKGDGITLFSSNNNRISETIAYDNLENGVSVYGRDNLLMNNTLLYNNTFNGIFIIGGSYNTLLYNVAFDNGMSGIELDRLGGENSDFNNLTGNLVYENNENGVSLKWSNNNTLTETVAYDNNLDGIYLDNSYDNNITGSAAQGNDINGVHLQDSNYNLIWDNFLNNNSENGIQFSANGNYNDIKGNTIYNNMQNGFILLGGNVNNITDNIIYDNNEDGIKLIDDSWANIIRDNDIYENGMNGISLLDVAYNEVYANMIHNNIDKGIYSTGTWECLFFENFFLRNGKHAFDHSTFNHWNNSIIGNYWDNHTSPDNDSDGIVDTSYYLGAGIDLLPIAEDGEPRIIIISPSEETFFSSSSPSFDVIVNDDYFESMWYTVDGGLNNHSFSENGMINQSTWDVLIDGNIKLKFYAIDIAGNIGTEEVDIIKDTIAPFIIINSPTEGDQIGNISPLFNITVTEENLDIFWYSFNGGVTTYSLINNTFFNQTAWTALSEGVVTITFYASDLAGNEITEYVTVTKSISSNSSDLTVIIILVSSVAGIGVLIVVTYFIIKKRKT